MKYHKPFLKWVGGKTQILDQIVKTFPREIKDYHELFLGGGSVLFALLTLQQEQKIKITGKIFAYDLNKNLIHLYQIIQNDKDKFFEYLQKFLTEYDSLSEKKVDKPNRKPKTLEDAKTCKESYYYFLRLRFNSLLFSSNLFSDVEKEKEKEKEKRGEEKEKEKEKEKKGEEKIEFAALLLFLNKTCFRGVYRESSNGFNVPYGHHKKTPTIITKEQLDKISLLIKDVEFKNITFEKSIKIPSEGDFVYLDPPYAPETKTSFVGYTKDGFTLDLHKKLFSEINNLNERNVKFCLSNSKVDLVTKSLKDFKIEELETRRTINSKKPESKTTEVIVTN